MIKILVTISFFIFFTNCGFTPIYKISDNNMGSEGYSIEIVNQVSREIIEEINTNALLDSDHKYVAFLNIKEDTTPLIINTNGTVAKYRIEIEISYELIQKDTDEVVSFGKTRGNAQYDVVSSEISNEDTKKSMTKIATKNALQIMYSRIQSFIASK